MNGSEVRMPKHKHNYSVIFPLMVGAFLAIFIGLVMVFGEDTAPVAKKTSSTKTVAPSYKPSVFEFKQIVTGLQSPTAIIASRTDNSLYVLEQAGKVRIINAAGQLDTTPFLDIRSKVTSGGEMGLLGLAFHPDFLVNGYLYVNYIDKQQNTIIARYQYSAETKRVNTGSAKVLLKLKQPYTNHNGGDLAFGPDGYLYAALGDGGSGGDPQDHAQDKNVLFGKILRLDVDNGDPYGIPASNPFAKATDAKPEIWAYGLRNPWRMSFDKKTGDLYIADVGQGSVEEVDMQAKNSKGGENYGWRCYEGNQAYQTSNCKSQDSYAKPILEYNHDEGRCSITGGYVYRGTLYPALIGKYFYGDYCNGQLFYAEKKNGTWSQTVAAKTDFSFSAFGQDTKGELYFANYNNGTIYQLQDTANPAKTK